MIDTVVDVAVRNIPLVLLEEHIDDQALCLLSNLSTWFSDHLDVFVFSWEDSFKVIINFWGHQTKDIFNVWEIGCAVREASTNVEQV